MTSLERLPAGSGQPPVQRLGPEGAAVPAIFDSPHSGLLAPADFAPVLSLQELFGTADAYVDELFGAAPAHGATLIGAFFPRSYIDANRADHFDPGMIDGPWPAPERGQDPTRVGLMREPAVRRAIYDRRYRDDDRARIDRCCGRTTRRSSSLDERMPASARSGTSTAIRCRPTAIAATRRRSRRADFVLGDRDGTTCDAEFTDFVARLPARPRLRRGDQRPLQGARDRAPPRPARRTATACRSRSTAPSTWTSGPARKAQVSRRCRRSSPTWSRLSPLRRGRGGKPAAPPLNDPAHVVAEHSHIGAALARAALMMVGASAILAVTSLLAKALGRGVAGSALHPFQVTAGRFGFALALLLVISIWLRPRLAGAAWGVHTARSLCGWAGATCLFAAAAAMPLAEATAISFLSPLATMILAIRCSASGSALPLVGGGGRTARRAVLIAPAPPPISRPR